MTFRYSAPGRVNLIGEHTDYNAGFVLPFAIDSRTFVEVSLRDDYKVSVRSSDIDGSTEIALSDLKPGVVSDWTAYPLGVVWAMLQTGQGSPRGLNLSLRSEVPIGAGLSSSAALECAVAVAVNDLWDCKLDRIALAKIGQQAENQMVGAPTGIMDQVASMMGARDQAVLIDCQDLSVRNVALGFEQAGLVLAVIDTKVAHRHADGGYASRRAACENGAALMGVKSLRELSEQDLPRAASLLDEVTYRRVKHVVTENARVLATVEALESTEPRSIAELMLASHASMRDDFEISVDELDCAVETAMSLGAVGARMTGGGFGGSAIALIDADQLDALRDGVTAEFSKRGFESPNVFVVQPSDGAGKEN